MGRQMNINKVSHITIVSLLLNENIETYDTEMDIGFVKISQWITDKV